MTDSDKLWGGLTDKGDFIEWKDLEGARLQIMRQAAMFGLLGVAWHCIMHHEPMLSMEGNTLHIYSMSGEKECDLYTKIDFHFTDDEIDLIDTLLPSNVLGWVMTAIMDPDTSKNFNHPAVIEGHKIRVEIG